MPPCAFGKCILSSVQVRNFKGTFTDLRPLGIALLLWAKATALLLIHWIYLFLKRGGACFLLF